HFREGFADLSNVREDFERARHIERRRVEWQLRDASLRDLEAAVFRERQHARRQIDADGAARETGKPVEDESRPTPALENVFAARVALDELDLEVVNERVVAVGGVRSAMLL